MVNDIVRTAQPSNRMATGNRFHIEDTWIIGRTDVDRILKYWHLAKSVCGMALQHNKGHIVAYANISVSPLALTSIATKSYRSPSVQIIPPNLLQ
jgi:hypothetical protein